MNSMKRQKARTLKDELPRSVGAQYATGDQWRNRHRDQTEGGGEEGEGEMYGESNMETYIIICRIDRQREFAVCLRKLKYRLCINLEGWHGEGDGWWWRFSR